MAMIAITGIALATGSPGLAQGTQPGSQAQEPKYACSISVPNNTPKAKLSELAKITAQQAETAAQATKAGTVERVKLEDENGCLVYSVKIKAADSKVYDVKVDAGTGKVVHQEVEGAEEEKEGDED